MCSLFGASERVAGSVMQQESRATDQVAVNALAWYLSRKGDRGAAIIQRWLRARRFRLQRDQSES
jgi:hypothetical protein